MLSSLNIKRLEELRLTQSDEAAISALVQSCFDVDFGGRSFFQNRLHCRFLCWEGNTLTGHLGLAYRAIQMGDKRVEIIGIADVAVSPTHRKNGIGKALTKAAVEEGKLASADFAALFGRQKIYTELGFQPAPNLIKLIEMEGADTGVIVEEINEFFQILPLGDMPWNFDVPVDLAGFAF